MLDPPEETLHSIAVHFEADAEKRASCPSQTCRRLHKVHMPCITLVYRNE